MLLEGVRWCTHKQAAEQSCLPPAPALPAAHPQPAFASLPSSAAWLPRLQVQGRESAVPYRVMLPGESGGALQVMPLGERLDNALRREA